MDNLVRLGALDAESSAEGRHVSLAIPVPAPHARNLGLGQLGGSGTTAVRKPALRIAVSHVVGFRSEEQMGGVTASLYITGMADEKAVRDWSTEQRPCEAMRPRSLPRDAGPAITIEELVARPEPAALPARAAMGDEIMSRRLACDASRVHNERIHEVMERRKARCAWVNDAAIA